MSGYFTPEMMKLTKRGNKFLSRGVIAGAEQFLDYLEALPPSFNLDSRFGRNFSEFGCDKSFDQHLVQ